MIPNDYIIPQSTSKRKKKHDYGQKEKFGFARRAKGERQAREQRASASGEAKDASGHNTEPPLYNKKFIAKFSCLCL